ncbi:deaminase [Thermoleophilia bacterium SCSIO 60948]|nr:deaminase [Thermoleophilia bacterium SCSIO 60948]
MARLRYSAIGSVDGFVSDADGRFDWAAPDEEVHAHVNDRERATGTFLLGRRTYELMTPWENDPELAEDGPTMADFAALWQAAEKIVFSRTLESASTSRTSIETDFDPAKVQELKATSEADIGIGGPTLAAHALKAGLVDIIDLYLVPVVIGSGLAALPHGLRLDLELLDDHRFANGTLHLRYGVR